MQVLSQCEYKKLCSYVRIRIRISIKIIEPVRKYKKVLCCTRRAQAGYRCELWARGKWEKSCSAIFTDDDFGTYFLPPLFFFSLSTPFQESERKSEGFFMRTISKVGKRGGPGRPSGGIVKRRLVLLEEKDWDGKVHHRARRERESAFVASLGMSMRNDFFDQDYTMLYF